MHSFFFKETQSFLKPNNWQTKYGNQNIGQAYTIGKTIVDEYDNVQTYIAELSIYENKVRNRIRFIYSNQNNSINSLSLIGFLIIKETKEDCSLDDLSLLYNPSLGTSIYDSDISFSTNTFVENTNYRELKLSGKLTLLFPMELPLVGRAGLTIQWESNELLYQIDRKFQVLKNNEINTFELTEIKPKDILLYSIEKKFM